VPKVAIHKNSNPRFRKDKVRTPSPNTVSFVTNENLWDPQFLVHVDMGDQQGHHEANCQVTVCSEMFKPVQRTTPYGASKTMQEADK